MLLHVKMCWVLNWSKRPDRILARRCKHYKEKILNFCSKDKYIKHDTNIEEEKIQNYLIVNIIM